MSFHLCPAGLKQYWVSYVTFFGLLTQSSSPTKVRCSRSITTIIVCFDSHLIRLISEMIVFLISKIVCLISVLIFWFPKFIRLISEMILLISKIVCLISEMGFDFQILYVWFLKWTIFITAINISARRIATSGQVNLLSIRRKFFSKSQPIRFVRLDSEHAQNDG